jgi:hypothetical protein
MGRRFVGFLPEGDSRVAHPFKGGTVESRHQVPQGRLNHCHQNRNMNRPMTFTGFSRPYGTCGLATLNPAVNCRAILNSPSGRKPFSLPRFGGLGRGRNRGRCEAAPCTAMMKLCAQAARIWSAVTCHRLCRFGDLSPKQGRVQRPVRVGRLPAFDGDKSPAESADRSAHSKVVAASPRCVLCVLGVRLQLFRSA